MDLIRMFADTAFVKMADRFLSAPLAALPAEEPGIIISEDIFVDEARTHRPEFTDDQLRVLYRLYVDEWSCRDGGRNIFNVLLRLAEEMVRLQPGAPGREPLVKFRHLFRWRELTQAMGEDILVCAALAAGRRGALPYDFRQPADSAAIDFCSWPTVLHNDNSHLTHIFRNGGLSELHSHLNASTDVFGINWVALMNEPAGRGKAFRDIAKSHNRSMADALGVTLYRYAWMAADIRLRLWRFVRYGEDPGAPEPAAEYDVPGRRDSIRASIGGERGAADRPDYIICSPGHPMSVIAGERALLFGVFDRMLRPLGRSRVAELFYRYILAKNRIRGLMIQVNANRGFANFNRYQNLKDIFVKGRPGEEALQRLPFWEAAEHNHVANFETRVSPSGNNTKAGYVARLARGVEELPLSERGRFDWRLIYHFIKKPDTEPGGCIRDRGLRVTAGRQSAGIIALTGNAEARRYVAGIDAAASELDCRPEVFGPVFRFLKDAGMAATFHAGEDFYDIADGLRAIHEAVEFLGLDSGDRLGHAVALGIDPREWYAERHNKIILPKQWLLDNAVWTYFRARELNVAADPKTADFLLSKGRSLLVELGYGAGSPVDLHDYYQSMQLRGDNPECYATGEYRPPANDGVPDGMTIGSYNARRGPLPEEIRRGNPRAAALYYDYHFIPSIREKGGRITETQVPEGYAEMIYAMQEGMQAEIAKRRIGIECCPSSNVRIGMLRRFDRHPVFRFMPVRGGARYPLDVTVNTDDLGVFATSLPNEFSLLALALLKSRDADGAHIYSSEEVYAYIERIASNGHKFSFR